MSFTHKQVISYVANGTTYYRSVEKTAGAQVMVEESIPTDSTDLAISIAIDVSAVESLYLESTVAMTLEINDGTTPDETISLVANEPVVWNKTYTALIANPLGTTDVTDIYVTNTTTGTLRVFALIDPTP